MIWHYIVLTVVLLVAELIYFRIARAFSIIDKPNDRSSHRIPTVRGSGIIFFISLLIWFGFEGFSLPWFVLGAILIAIISFIDDLQPVSAIWRFIIQTISVAFVFYQLAPFDWSWWLVLTAGIICIGTLNAFNFMDGINGITGLYALINLLTFEYVNRHLVKFSEESLILVFTVAVLVFLFFNFRKQAVGFAGDIGSVTLAYFQIFLLLALILETDNFLWVILFLAFGVDSVITIAHRILNKENIFKPHRTHLYQFLSNELSWPHLAVTSTYGFVQLCLNAILVYSIAGSNFALIWWAAILFVLAYVGVRLWVLRKIRNTNVVR